VARALDKASRATSSALVQAAIAAVPKIAEAAGRPISQASADAGRSGANGGGILTLAIVALVAAALAGGVILARERLSGSE